MAKIWRLNSLFEYELGAYPDQPVFNKSILRRNSSIEKLFFLIADPEDFVVTTDPLAESTKEYFGKEEIQLGKEINHLENIPDGKLVEWGQTSIVSDSKMKPDPSIIEQSKFLNSKATQAKFKQNTGISPFRIGVGKSINDIENFSINIDNPFVLKQAFNFAGRGQVVVRNSSDLKKIKNLATWTGRDPFVMEEWQESRNSDFSGLFEISGKSFRLLAITEMVISGDGRYSGSVFFPEKYYNFQDALCETMDSFLQYSDSKYEGPASLDGFTFLQNGIQKTNVFSEINFRYSMGRIMYELSRRFREKGREFGLTFAKSETILNEIPRLETQFKSKILAITPFSDGWGRSYDKIGCFLYGQNRINKLISIIKK